MLDHRKPARGGDEPGRGRDVDRSRKIAARAAAVGEHVAGGREGPRRFAQRLGCADQLLGGLAPDSKRDEGGGHQRLAELTLDKALEQLARSGAIEVVAVEKPGDRRLGDVGCDSSGAAGAPRPRERPAPLWQWIEAGSWILT